MKNLTDTKIAFKPKENLLVSVCLPIDNPYSEDDFLDLMISMTPATSLVGRCVYHNPGENICTIELEHPTGLSVELDLDLFDVTEVG